MKHVTRPLIALALLALVVPASVSHAQHDAGWKVRGEQSFYGNSAGSAMRSARDYSNYYSEYAQSAPAQQANPEVARESADTIGAYITKAQRHFSYMRTQAQASNDKETLVELDAIDKNLSAAAKSHHEMHDTCLKANVDASGSMKCCQQIDASLDAAIAEHDKLMKRLAGSKPAAPKK